MLNDKKLEFTDSESGEQFEGWGVLLGEARIYGVNYPKAMLRLYRISRDQIHPEKPLPDYVVTALLKPGDLLVEQFQDSFGFAFWCRGIVEDNYKTEGENALYVPLMKIFSDVSPSNPVIKKISRSVAEYRRALQGDRKSG